MSEQKVITKSRREPKNPKPFKNAIILVSVILILLLVGGIYFSCVRGKNNSSTTTSMTDWSTYTMTPSIEESSEFNSAVKFSIRYPNVWHYRVLDDEVKAQGAGSALHTVAFDVLESDKINLVTKKLLITADSKDFNQAVTTVTNGYQESGLADKISQTQGTAGGGKMIKIVDNNRQNTNDTDRPLYVFVQSPSNWILTFEGSTQDEPTIDLMLSTLTF